MLRNAYGMCGLRLLPPVKSDKRVVCPCVVCFVWLLSQNYCHVYVKRRMTVLPLQTVHICMLFFPVSGPGSVVGIATGFGLDGPGIESRWGARFTAPVQTGREAHLASCSMGTGSFPGVNSGRVVTLTLHPLLVPWS